MKLTTTLQRRRRNLVVIIIAVATAIVTVVVPTTSAARADSGQNLTGVINVVRGAALDGVPRTSVSMTLPNGQKIGLPALPVLLNLDREQATVRGAFRPDGVFQPSAVQPSDPNAHGGGGDASLGLADKLGPQPWITLLCNFNDNSTQPQPLSYFQTLIGDQPATTPSYPSMDHYWRELSYERMNLEGSEERDWMTLPGNQADYREDDPDDDGTATIPLFNLIAQDCIDLHDSTVDFDDFVGVNLMFNSSVDSCCAWGGGENVDTDEGSKNFDMTWMPPFGWGNHDVLGQEMGHGFGLPHSSGPYDATYDSQWDVMSAGGTCSTKDPDYGCVGVHTISPHKDALGWITSSEHYEADMSQEQVVTLARLALPTFNPNPGGETPSLMASIPIPDTDNDYFSVEARKNAGYDDGEIPGEGVVIHRVDPDLGDRQAQVVDSTPGGTNDDGSIWVPGETFEDDVSGIKIQVLSETTNGFVVVINPITVADLRVTKIATPSQAVAGDNVTYDITVRNLGPGTAEDVVLVDTLPAGVTYLADTGGCVLAAGVLTCDIGQLQEFASTTISVLVEVDDDLVAVADGPTTITNVAEVSQNEEILDPDLSNNVAELTTIVVEEADLVAYKDCKPDQQLDAGETATCTITVDNLGPSVARDVEVLDEILSEGTFSVPSADATPGFCSPSSTGPVSDVDIDCTLGDLGVGIDVGEVIIDQTAMEAVDINDRAVVSSVSPDPDASNNEATDSVSVRAIADVSVTKTGSASVTAGNSFVYMLTVENAGVSTAEGVVLEDYLPGGVSVSSIVATVGSCTAGVPGDAARPTVCTIGNLSPSDSETVTINVTVDPDTRSGLWNDVVASATTHDPDVGNNVASFATDVVSEGSLTISKTATPDPVVAGEVLSYEIVVGNTGPSSADDVVITDALDADVDFQSATLVGDDGTCVIVQGAAAPPYEDVVTCTLIDNIDPGASVTVFIDVLVDPAVPHLGAVNDLATADGSNTDAVETNLSTVVNAVADLSIVMDSNFETGNSSTTIIYTIDVTNAGPSVARSVVIDHDLPSVLKKNGGEKVVFVFATEPCVYDLTVPHSVSCPMGDMDVGETLSVEVHVQVKGNTGPLDSTATVSSATFDPDSSNDSDLEKVTVQGGSDRPGGPGGGRGKPT